MASPRVKAVPTRPRRPPQHPPPAQHRKALSQARYNAGTAAALLSGQAAPHRVRRRQNRPPRSAFPAHTGSSADAAQYPESSQDLRPMKSPSFIIPSLRNRFQSPACHACNHIARFTISEGRITTATDGRATVAGSRSGWLLQQAGLSSQSSAFPRSASQRPARRR